MTVIIYSLPNGSLGMVMKSNSKQLRKQFAEDMDVFCNELMF